MTNGAKPRKEEGGFEKKTHFNEESNPPSYAGENGISRSVHDINKKPPMLK